MAQYRSLDARENAAGVPVWLCVIAAVAVVAIGSEIAIRIARWERSTAIALVPPGPEGAGLGAAPVVTAPDCGSETPEVGSEAAGSVAPAYPPPPVGVEPATGNAPTDETGPEWTRQPLPLPTMPEFQRVVPGSPPEPAAAARRREALSPGRPAAPSAEDREPAPGDDPSAGVRPRLPSSAAALRPHLPPPEQSAIRTAPPRMDAAATADTPLRLRVVTRRDPEARYTAGEWVVLQTEASAPCHVAVYRVGASGTVRLALAPEEKPGRSYGVAMKAGEFGAGEEWAVVLASTVPLSDVEWIALLRARDDSPAEGAPINAVLGHLESQAPEEEVPLQRPEPWQFAVAVTRYTVTTAPRP